MCELRIDLLQHSSKVVLNTDDVHAFHLQNVLRPFETSILLDQSSGSVELEDFLANLRHLQAWPTDGIVVWAPELERVVRSMISDSSVVEAALGTGSITENNVNLVLGRNWTAPLTNNQRADLEKLLRLKHGANFSVPGAGKTRTTLAFFSHLKETGAADRALIVGPKSAYGAWTEENTKCFESPLRIGVWGDGHEEQLEVAIINYERLNSKIGELASWLKSGQSLLILDEAHRMKLGANGVYGSACLALGPLANVRMILSGTPAPNGTEDLENLFSFVWPGYGKQHVANSVRGGDLSRASKLLKPLYVRTTKTDLHLPPIKFRRVSVHMQPLHKEIYKALIGQYSSRVRNSHDDFESIGRIMMYLLMAATSPALLTLGSSRYDPLEFKVPPISVPENSDLYELLQDLPNYEFSAKYQEVLALIRENVQKNRKTIIWSTFVRNLTTMERILWQYNPAIVHGSSKDRASEIERFKIDSSCMVLLTNPATLGEGISLHMCCHDAIYLDRDFSAGRFQQSVDRIHRLGLPQDQETRVTILETQGTIDEVVSNRLDHKLAFLGEILDDESVQALSDLEEASEIGPLMEPADLRAIIEFFDANSS